MIGLISISLLPVTSLLPVEELIVNVASVERWAYETDAVANHSLLIF